MAKFGETRPYSNIAESEKTHIAYLADLYAIYALPLPSVNTEDHIALPENLMEAAKIGVQAEIANIAMYERFLEEELPEDIRTVFLMLKNASENHLKAFERQTSKEAGINRRR